VADPVGSRPLVDKLGVRPAMRVAIVGVPDSELRALLAERTDDVTVGEPLAGTDLVFLAVDGPADMARLPALRDRIAPAGAIWAVSPRGRPEIADVHVIAAAKAAGLVDNKVVRFSDTHTALRLVIRRALRGR
jgi:hypothetical protein